VIESKLYFPLLLLHPQEKRVKEKSKEEEEVEEKEVEERSLKRKL
jgi:hypothetical protein